MKTLLVLILIGSTSYAGDHYVNGYYKKDGTYVQGHYQTNPNNTNLDNYSTVGNANPYTGQAGTVQPDYNTYQHKPKHEHNPFLDTNTQPAPTADSLDQSTDIYGAPKKKKNNYGY